MDRNSQNSSAFSPSLFDQYNKNKQCLPGPHAPAGNQALAAQAQAALNAAAAWNYGALGNISGMKCTVKFGVLVLDILYKYILLLYQHS